MYLISHFALTSWDFVHQIPHRGVARCTGGDGASFGGLGRRVSADNFFRFPKCEIWGDGGGLTVSWN